MDAEKKFEHELKELETVVARIDSGELSLEESIGAFERGVALVRSLNQKLESNAPADLFTGGPEGVEDLIKKDKVVAGTNTPFAVAGRWRAIAIPATAGSFAAHGPEQGAPADACPAKALSGWPPTGPSRREP